MKKILFFVIMAAMGLSFTGCTSSDDGSDEGSKGSIYGILTAEGSAEPMCAMRVELWKNTNYMMGTVTSDDGQYEFTDLIPDAYYELKVNAEGYEELVYNVIVEAGRRARADLQLKKLQTRMTVRTLDVSDLNGTSLTLNGSVAYSDYSYYPKEAGFYYSTTSNPQEGTRVTGQLGDDKSLTRNFTTGLKNLRVGKYYLQAYAKNAVGVAYGEVKTFEITGEPSVSTLEVTNIAETTATLNGLILYDGDPVYTERGFVYSNSYPTPTVDDPAAATTKVVVSGTSKEFSANVASLVENVVYYVRAYATNQKGTSYGEVMTFKPEPPAYVVMSDYVIIENMIMIQKRDLSPSATWEEAKAMCAASTTGGYNDWRLPTLGEFKLIYSYRDELDDYFSYEYMGDKYWTSSIYTDEYPYAFSLYYGSYSDYYAYNRHYVHAVRTVK